VSPELDPDAGRGGRLGLADEADTTGEPGVTDTTREPGVTDTTREPGVTDTTRESGLPGTAGVPGTDDMEGPLLGDVAGMRSSWGRIQAQFVDDPREAVADAAALVDHAAQALVGMLQRRQQRLRGMWDGASLPGSAPRAADGDDSPGVTGSGEVGQPTATRVPDTEQLRLLMQRYRSLFDEICRP
jgi:hypothetical protein